MRTKAAALAFLVTLAACFSGSTSTSSTTQPEPSTSSIPLPSTTAAPPPSSTTAAPPPSSTTSTPIESTTTMTSPSTTSTTTTPSGVLSYIVQAGDTLWSVAVRFDTTVEAIVSLNDLTDPSSIEVGQLLLIPVGNGGDVTANVLRRGPEDQSMVALTFDAGSDAGHTTEILDILAGYGILASFGLTGRWVEANPDLAARIADQGHVIVNHSFGHRSVTGFSTDTAPLTEAERRTEVTDGESAIITATGVSPRPFFRPPYGDYDNQLLDQLPQWGYSQLVMWSLDSLGWNGLSAGSITERCLSAAEPGAIFLFHVGAASEDYAALPAIIDGLGERGLRPVALTEMLAG